MDHADGDRRINEGERGGCGEWIGPWNNSINIYNNLSIMKGSLEMFLRKWLKYGFGLTFKEYVEQIVESDTHI